MFRGLLVLCVASLTLPWAHGDEGDSTPPQAGNMLGARTQLSPTHPDVKKVAQFAVETFNRDSNTMYYFRDTKILKAERQLVTGIKYFLTMEMGSTACRKGVALLEGENLAGCPFSSEEEKIKCDFEILVVPWKKQNTLQNISCVPA